MDFFYFMLIFLSLAGVIFVGFSVFISGGDESGDAEQPASALLSYVNLIEKMQGIDTSIAEADSVLTEINDVSAGVFKEIDNKYQELLFLYNLIDEKKKMLAEEAEQSRVEQKIPETAERYAERYVGKTEDEPVIDTAAIEQLLAPSPPKSAARRRNAAPKTFKNPKGPEIIRLREQGLSVTDIARKLNVGQGEIAMILSLYDTDGGGGLE